MKKALSVTLACSVTLSLVVYGGDSKPTEAPTTAAAGDTATTTAADATAADIAVTSKADAEMASKDKLLVWFNHQPSGSATGQLDTTALNPNKDTYYVGSDANQGTELQGTMVRDYIEKNIDSIGRSDNGVIDYVLAIDDIRHNDSIARTRGTRKALDTAVEKDGNINNDPVGTNVNGAATVVQDDSIEVGGKTYVVREPASQEMENSTGATWDAATADNTIGTWPSSFGDQIDVIASNNDGMSMSMFNTWSKDNKVPTFDYDADSDAIAAIVENYGDAINQHADIQAYLTLRVLRNVLNGVDIDTSIGTTDDVDNILSSDVYVYKVDERSYYALNIAATAENHTGFTDSTMVYAPAPNQLDGTFHTTKNVWLNIYNSADNSLKSIYQPLPQKCDKLLDLKVDYIGGDGQAESDITDRLENLNQYDTFAINMVKAGNATSYTSLLEQ